MFVAGTSNMIPLRRLILILHRVLQDSYSEALR